LPLPISRTASGGDVGRISRTQSTIFSILSSPNLYRDVNKKTDIEDAEINIPNFTLVADLLEVLEFGIVYLIPASFASS
jgi:hypothetical protein